MQKESKMLENNFSPITRESVFKQVMSDEQNCLGLLQIILEDLNLQTADIVLGHKGASNFDYNWNQINILSKSQSGDVYNIKLNMFNNPKNYHRYMKGMNPDAWEPARPIQTKGTYIICFCTFDPFDQGKAIYEFNLKRENDDQEMEDWVHVKILSAAAM